VPVDQRDPVAFDDVLAVAPKELLGVQRVDHFAAQFAVERVESEQPLGTNVACLGQLDVPAPFVDLVIGAGAQLPRHRGQLRVIVGVVFVGGGDARREECVVDHDEVGFVDDGESASTLTQPGRRSSSSDHPRIWSSNAPTLTTTRRYLDKSCLMTAPGIDHAR
jgi:hypothetical protein